MADYLRIMLAIPLLLQGIMGNMRDAHNYDKEGKKVMGTIFTSVKSRGAAERGIPRIVFCGAWLKEMGFEKDALVKVLPEPNGISFTLCNDNITRYSDLARATEEQNGRLIQVIFSNNEKNYGEMINTTGRYITSTGLSVGDTMIAEYSYGLVRMRKINGTVGIVGSMKDRTLAEKQIPVIRLFDKWLTETGFVRDALATVSSKQGCITLNLQDNGIERYSALVKYARENKLKLFQVRQYFVSKNPYIEIKGSCLNNAGFNTGDIFEIHYEYGLIKIRKLWLKELGF